MSTTPSGTITASNVRTALNVTNNGAGATNYPTNLISFNDSLVRILAGKTTAGSAISMNDMRNKAGPNAYGTAYDAGACGVSGQDASTFSQKFNNGTYGTYQVNTLNSSLCLVPGNGGLFTTSGTFTVPASSGGTIKILCIGAGGAGGSGSARTSEAPTSGGGGGGSGEITLKTYTVAVGTVLTITVGTGGSPGSPTSGFYGGGTNSTGGGATTVKNGTTVIAGAGGGGAGGLSATAPNYPVMDNYSPYFNTNILTPTGPFVSGGAGGSGGGGASGYTNPYSSVAGGSAGYVGFVNGGDGGRGYTINTTVNVATPYGTGSAGATGHGSDAGQYYNDQPPSYLYYWIGGTNRNRVTQPGAVATTGTTYGGGGGGGGKDNPYNASTSGINGAKGGNGAVFIWWGY
jgi:hypothetical protein